MLIFDPFYFSHLRVNSSEIPSRMGIPIALRVIYADRLDQRPFSKFSIAAVLRIAFISRVFPPRAQLGQLTNSYALVAVEIVLTYAPRGSGL